MHTDYYFIQTPLIVAFIPQKALSESGKILRISIITQRYHHIKLTKNHQQYIDKTILLYYITYIIKGKNSAN